MASLTSPKAHPITGHLADFRADRLGFFTRCARTYGDVVPLRVFGRRMLLISRPELIEQVLVTQAKNFVKHFGLRMYVPILGNGLVTSEGDFWRRQRKLSAPAFQAARLAGYARAMASSAAEMLDTWREAGREAETKQGSSDGLARDVHSDLMRLTLEIACKSLFGADACPNPDAVGRSMDVGLRAIDVRFGRLFPIPDWFPTPSNLRLRRSMRTLDGVVRGVIDRRREAVGSGANGGGANGTGAADGQDLLSTLLRARDEDGSAMTDGQLLDEVRTLFLAGHETTALALTYSLYLLAAHPAVQAELFTELSSVLSGRQPAYCDLPSLAYTRKVVTEAMRLYPPADVLGREAIANCTIGDVPVSKGTTIFMSQWVMHRDPRYFHDSESFDPARWTDEFERSLPRFAYFPFGGGPRFCVGQTFATTEAILVLATLCQRFAFAPDPTFRLELWPSITLRPAAGVRVLVRDRGTPAAST